jgi:hypothetical protein
MGWVFHPCLVCVSQTESEFKMSKTTAHEIDPGVLANRDSTWVFRYRVRDEGWRHGIDCRGRHYNPGEILLLNGQAAHSEFGYSLELVSPEPVEQTEDPSTWEAQHATSLHVNLNSHLRINQDGVHVKAEYDGAVGGAIARVRIAFTRPQWFVESFVTPEDAERLYSELGAAIAEMRTRMFCNPDVDENYNIVGEGELWLHQHGGVV